MIVDKILLEYIWIDIDDNTRFKTKIINKKNFNFNSLPDWNFDGSSTNQSKGNDSDILIKPKSIYPNPFINYIESYLVLCDCWNKDNSPHITNNRVNLVNTCSKCIEQEPIFGIEQEYVIFEKKTNLPYKWLKHNEPGMGPQGPYYCGVGGGVSLGREISSKHLELCLKTGLEICGINGEVMASQWEYQIGPLSPVELSDQIWISRYILHRVSEEFDCIISFHPKPYINDNINNCGWNGSGAHTNFSTKIMRDFEGIEEIKKACEKLSHTHLSHMKVYGKFNEERMNGIYETSSMDKFTWAVSNRGCSVRIPLNVVNDKCGYLEDRRPASNIDPYLVCEKICSTICLN
jgi:glutamine synthetase